MILLIDVSALAQIHKVKKKRLDGNYACYDTESQRAYSAISNVNLCVTGPLWHIRHRHSLWMYLTVIGQQNVNGAALESWRVVVDHELRCQFINDYDIRYLFKSTVYLIVIHLSQYMSLNHGFSLLLSTLPCWRWPLYRWWGIWWWNEAAGRTQESYPDTHTAQTYARPLEPSREKRQF